MTGYDGGWYYPAEIKTYGDKIYYSAPPVDHVDSGLYIHVY